MSEEQIKEMAKVTMEHCKIDNQCGSCHWTTCNECLADVLYNAGYRKASDVAREIILEIDTLICCHGKGDIDDKTLYVLFKEFKKKHMNNCIMCKHVVSCEPNPFGVCDEYEAKNG